MSRRRYARISKQMDDIVGQMHRFHFRYTELTRVWEPPINVYGYPDHFEIYVELAGVAPQEFQVEVEGRRVRIAGVRRWPDLRCKSTGARCRRTTLMEIEEGPFVRDIELPVAVDANSSEISANDGLVWIRLNIACGRR